MKSKEELKKSRNVVFGIVIFIIILIFMIVLIATLVNEKNGTNNNASIKASDEASVTEAPAYNTKAPESTENNNTLAPTENPTATPGESTATATVNPTAKITENPGETPSFTPRANKGYAEVIDANTIDYSFLDGISTLSLDGNEEYDWYPGQFSYNEATKTVVPGWGERSKTVLNYIKKYNSVYVQNSDEKVIYLTFDCGYENGVTEKILDTLKEKDVDAIFFVTGDYLLDSKHYDLAKILNRMLDEGNLIGSHTDHHPLMPKCSNTKFVEELNGCYTRLRGILGDDFKMTYYRPPQGASSPRDLALAYYLGYKSTFWTYAYVDYNIDNQPTKESAMTTLKKGLRPGAVYLLHAISTTNAEVLGDFIDWVRSQGYEIRRIDK